MYFGCLGDDVWCYVFMDFSEGVDRGCEVNLSKVQRNLAITSFLARVNGFLMDYTVLNILLIQCDQIQYRSDSMEYMFSSMKSTVHYIMEYTVDSMKYTVDSLKYT